MKFVILFSAIWVLGFSTVRAQLELPDLKIKQENRSLDLVGLSIEVTIEGILAETVLELEYFNSGRRNAEGEFTLRLPEGATVSTYALEVNGEMRPGVAVAKEQAHFAYESIKARRIDPGLVEREKGNIYRTRIFPIVGNQKKRVRIGFIHSIKDGVYEFPLNGTAKVKKFSCSIWGDLKGEPSLVLENEERKANLKFGGKAWIMNDVKPVGMLRCESKLTEGREYQTRFDLDEEGNLYFVTQGEVIREEGPSWESFRLVWDTSLSGSSRNLEAEVSALKKIFGTVEKSVVGVHFLGETLGAEKQFTIREGKVDELIAYLKSAGYEGIADFSKIPPYPGNTLLFSDGRTALPDWGLPQGIAGHDIYLMRSGPGKPSPAVAGNVADLVDIELDGWWDALQYRRAGISRSTLPENLIDYSKVGDRFIVSGKVPKDKLPGVSVEFRQGAGVNFSDWQNMAKTGEWNFARRIWAERRLARLEKSESEEKIAKFAVEERLVSDYTSLIVLERFEDHLTYNIPPPEPALLARYLREKNERPNSAPEFARIWNRKILWHQHDFVWFDGPLKYRLQNVEIFARSSRVAFSEKTMNRKPIEQYETWAKQCRQTIGKRDAISSGEEFKNWLKEIDGKIVDLDEIRKKAPSVDSNGDVHVSLRGDVRERGIFTSKPPYSLQEVIQNGGGVSQSSSMSKVFLYRDGLRTGYNLLSRSLEPIPLKWGDMIVVEKGEEQWDDRFDGFAPFAADPFAAPSAGGAPGPVPAVFEEAGSFQPAKKGNVWSSEDSEKKTGGDRFAEGPLSFKKRTPEFFEQLGKEDNRWEFYLKNLKSEGGLTVPDTIRAARIFFDKKEKEEGSRVLSNLLETIENPVEACRTYAYWIAEFGSPFDGRKALISALQTPNLDDRTRALLYFDIGQITTDAGAYQKSAEIELSNANPTELGAMALTDAFVLEAKSVEGITPYRMTSDYRVVVTSMGQDYSMKVEIPSHFRLMMDDDSYRRVSSSGVTEHQTIKALPGIAKIKLEKAEEGTYHIRIYRRYGHADQKLVKEVTIYHETPSAFQVGELNFGWEDIDGDELLKK